jgi:malonyl-CoA/methylmalonyl-CoA synthetase
MPFLASTIAKQPSYDLFNFFVDHIIVFCYLAPALTLPSTPSISLVVSPPSNMPTRQQLPLIARILSHPRSKIALTTNSATTTYSSLLQTTAILADKIARTTSPSDRVAYLCPPSSSYVTSQLAAFTSSTVAVPLCTSHTPKELAYYLSDSSPRVIITQTPEYRAKIEAALSEAKLTSEVTVLDYDEQVPGSSSRKDETISVDDSYAFVGAHSVELDSRALFVYTSGTTGPPKGVVTTHKALTHQITDLVSSWEWTGDDRILVR